MDDPVFGSGLGTPVIQDPASPNINNVTTSKQPVSSTTGLVVLASDHVAKRYWFADRPLNPVIPAPVASFTATPTTGTAPLPVSFTDTSTGAPTSWSWTFGDGGSATTQNPTHTYAEPGTYTARLTATNSAGSTTATSTITVNAVTPPGGVAVVGSVSAYAGTAAGTVTLSAPSGTADGDVLVASITADMNPSMTSVPAGWTPIVNALGNQQLVDIRGKNIRLLPRCRPSRPPELWLDTKFGGQVGCWPYGVPRSRQYDAAGHPGRHRRQRNVPGHEHHGAQCHHGKP